MKAESGPTAWGFSRGARCAKSDSGGSTYKGLESERWRGGPRCYVIGSDTRWSPSGGEEGKGREEAHRVGRKERRKKRARREEKRRWAEKKKRTELRNRKKKRPERKDFGPKRKSRINLISEF